MMLYADASLAALSPSAPPSVGVLTPQHVGVFLLSYWGRNCISLRVRGSVVFLVFPAPKRGRFHHLWSFLRKSGLGADFPEVVVFLAGTRSLLQGVAPPGFGGLRAGLPPSSPLGSPFFLISGFETSELFLFSHAPVFSPDPASAVGLILFPP